MTQDQIRRALYLLRYDGKWSLKKIARQAGLSPSTISQAISGASISEHSQARLSSVIPLIPRKCPNGQPKKKKPGRFKQYLIRYYNLMRWLSEIEKQPGIEKHFRRNKERSMSRNRAAFVCAKLDYQLKYHLLSLFGRNLTEKKIVLADCYPVERWIERIHNAIPNLNVALFEKLRDREIEKLS